MDQSTPEPICLGDTRTLRYLLWDVDDAGEVIPLVIGSGHVKAVIRASDDAFVELIDCAITETANVRTLVAFPFAPTDPDYAVGRYRLRFLVFNSGETQRATYPPGNEYLPIEVAEDPADDT